MAEYTIDKFTYGGNTYKLQDNVSGYTSNTGTVTSVGVSNATNGGLTISGSPITSSGSITVGHSNVLTSAQTTEAVYPIKIDKNGHISSYGTAVTISDTKNTAGSTNSTSKLYLIGATEQSANPQTYSNSNLYFSNGLHADVSAGGGATGTYISQTSSVIGIYGYNETLSKSAAIKIDACQAVITSLITPTNDYDAATKKYVDDSIPVLTFTPDGTTHNLTISWQSVSSIQNGNEESY